MKNYSQIIVWILVVIGIIIILATKNENPNRNNTQTQEVTTEGENDKDPEEVATGEEDETVASGVMIPFEEGDFVYSFDEFNWELTPEFTPGVTKTSFRLRNFSRDLDGSPITLRRPFGAGSVNGTCTEGGAIETDKGIGLNSLTCVSGDDTSEYVAYQDKENTNRIMIERTNPDGSVDVARELFLNQIIK